MTPPPWYMGWFDWLISHSLTLELYLSREKILEDTFQQLATVHHSYYKKPLEVQYYKDVCVLYCSDCCTSLNLSVFL